jgi:hypothetical protein
MNTKYYVHKLPQSNGDHEVHAEGCQWMPKLENRQYLGEHNTCVTAVTTARLYFNRVNGCKNCSNACHTQ